MAARHTTSGEWDAHHDVHLLGAAAAEWLNEQGIVVDPRRHIQIYADLLARESFGILRVWHTPTSVQSVVAPTGTTAVILVVDGVLNLRHRGSAGSDHALTADNVGIVASGQTVDLECTNSVAYILLRARTAALHLAELGLPGSTECVPSADPYRAAFISLVNSLLASPDELNDTGNHFAEHALIDLVPAIIRNDVNPLVDARSSRASLVRAASQVIATRSRNPDFTTVGLCQELGISRATLDRAFVDHGTTAAKALERRRVKDALRMITSISNAKHSYAEIARRCGFTSRRSMVRALKSFTAGDGESFNFDHATDSWQTWA